MKTNKGFRDENHADELRKAKRLDVCSCLF